MKKTPWFSALSEQPVRCGEYETQANDETRSVRRFYNGRGAWLNPTRDGYWTVARFGGINGALGDAWRGLTTENGK